MLVPLQEFETVALGTCSRSRLGLKRPQRRRPQWRPESRPCALKSREGGRERRPLYSVLTLTLSLSPLRYCCFVPVVPPSSSSSSSSSRVWLQYPRRQERGQLTSGTGKQRPPDSRCWIFSPSLHAVATCHTSLRSGYFIIPPRFPKFQAGRMSSEPIRSTSWKRLPMNCVSILDFSRWLEDEVRAI